MTRLIAIAGAAVLAALMGGIWLLTLGGQGDDGFAQCRASVVAGGAGSIGGPFELVDETGATVTDDQVLDEPALVYFGYTYCPDVCPLDLARNVEAVTLLEDRGYSVKPVFISVDPQRDTPEQLAEFTDYLHPRLLGLTGSEAQIKGAAQAYRAFYQVHAPDAGDKDYYLVDHSTFTYLTLPGTGFAEFFRRDDTAAQMVDKVQCFLDVR
jgi:protein SCO1